MWAQFGGIIGLLSKKLHSARFGTLEQCSTLRAARHAPLCQSTTTQAHYLHGVRCLQRPLGLRQSRHLQEASTRRCFPKESREENMSVLAARFVGERACRSEMWSEVNIGRKWMLEAQIVPKRGLPARRWAKIGQPTWRRNKARYDTLTPSSPRFRPFWNFGNLARAQKIENNECRSTQTRPISQRNVAPRFAKRLCSRTMSTLSVRSDSASS